MNTMPSAPDPTELTTLTRRHALDLGFDACRITDASAPDHQAAFEHWLRQGRHGTMQYLERGAAKRGDLQRVLPGARSVITLAISYYQAPARYPGPNDAPRPTGLLARYARFDDYHDVLKHRLEALTAFLHQQGEPDTRSLAYTDTGPILERDLAQRAGLGFIGKHTNLIHRRLGNWIFLAEILTTARLAPDTPERNRCGSCARCIVSCPTGAIVAPFELDARRCISYLTIELRDSIPEPLRPLLGDRVFGCDDCLAACPWNRFAREGALMRAHSRTDLERVDLVPALEMDAEEFRRRFATTPLQRVKHRGFRRNVCVALGNVGDARALPALDKAARGPDPMVAEHAAWAMGRIADRTGASPRR